jgi:hypothetical protein
MDTYNQKVCLLSNISIVQSWICGWVLQTLSDGTYSQSDVNQTLDTAFLSLLPKSAQNHCIYKEIEQQLGIVKAQITGHIPVRSTMPFGVDMSIPQTHTA